AVARADLPLAAGGTLGVARHALALVQPRAQDLERLGLVLVLRLFVLLGDHDAGRQMGDAHRAVGGVDRLAARAARTVDVNAQVVLVELNVVVLGLGQHGDRGRRRVDAPRGLGHRHALDAVHARLVLEAAEHAAALDRDDHLLDPAAPGVADRERLERPAAQLGVALVHAIEAAGEPGRLPAAGARADLQDRALGVRLVLGQQRQLDRPLQRRQAPLQRAQLLLGERAHLPVEARIGDHLAQTRRLLDGRTPFPDAGGDRLELGVFDRERSVILAARLGQGVAELLVTGENALELGFESAVAV